LWFRLPSTTNYNFFAFKNKVYLVVEECRKAYLSLIIVLPIGATHGMETKNGLILRYSFSNSKRLLYTIFHALALGLSPDAREKVQTNRKTSRSKL
jgi:hypothetical protein